MVVAGLVYCIQVWCDCYVQTFEYREGSKESSFRLV